MPGLASPSNGPLVAPRQPSHVADQLRKSLLAIRQLRRLRSRGVAAPLLVQLRVLHHGHLQQQGRSLRGLAVERHSGPSLPDTGLAMRGARRQAGDAPGNRSARGSSSRGPFPAACRGRRIPRRRQPYGQLLAGLQPFFRYHPAQYDATFGHPGSSMQEESEAATEVQAPPSCTETQKVQWHKGNP